MLENGSDDIWGSVQQQDKFSCLVVVFFKLIGGCVLMSVLTRLDVVVGDAQRDTVDGSEAFGVDERETLHLRVADPFHRTFFQQTPVEDLFDACLIGLKGLGYRKLCVPPVVSDTEDVVVWEIFSYLVKDLQRSFPDVRRWA